MRFDRFDHTVWAVLAGLAAALALVIAVGDRVGARVIATHPAPQVGLASTGRVGVEFAQAMQVPSTESAFSLEPPAAGRFSWQGRQMWFQPAQPLTPGLTYTARLGPGALSQGGQRVRREVVWSFTIRPLEVAFLNEGELYRVPLAGGAPQQLTRTGGRVYDYGPAPDGEQLVFSVINDQQGIDLWRAARDGSAARSLVNCGMDRCSVPVFAPDGRRLAYSRETAPLAPGLPHGPPRAWLADALTGQTAPVLSDAQVLGYGPVWSPDGRRLAWLDGSEAALRLRDLDTGQERLAPTQMGMVGSWSPDGSSLLYPDVDFTGPAPRTLLYLIDFASGRVLPALGRGAPEAEYGWPDWSPVTGRVLIGLQAAEAPAARQLWVMQPDGSQARPLTQDPGYAHVAYRWGPAGQRAVFQRFELVRPYPQMEIAVWEAETGAVRGLAPNGAQPQWLP